MEEPWSRHAVDAAAGAGLLAVSWLLLDGRRGVVPGWESDLFEVVNRLPDVLEWPLWPVMQLGNFWMCSVGGIIAYSLTKRWPPALAAGSSVLLAWAAANVVKDLLERGRPADLLGEVTLRESGVDGQGYVSGHAAISFALATVLTPLVPRRWRWVPFALATGVAFARVYYGAHLPLDVVGGAGVGVLCGLVSSLAFGVIRPRRQHEV
jgi:membrane-associated phospholipid phosphatase